MAVKISPVGRQQFFDNQGRVAAGMQLFTYAATTTNKRSTFTDSTGNVANDNPIELDSAGRTPHGLWLTDGLLYKFVLAPANDTDPPASPVWTEDNIGANEATLAAFAASSGSSLVGFIQAGSGAVARTAQSKMREIVSVTDYGAVGDDSTNNQTVLQAIFDAFPNATIEFPGDNGEVYRSGGSIILTDTNRHFAGNIVGRGKPKIRFTDASGSSGDTNAAMKLGFASYTNTSNNEFNGWQHASIKNIYVIAPANGAGWFLANGGYITFERCTVEGGRYGWALDGTIGYTFSECWGNTQTRASWGILQSGNAKVYYAALNFNDTVSWRNGCSISGDSAIFGIEDHGSSVSGQRVIDGMTCHSTSIQQCYVGRKNVSLAVRNLYTELIPYPIMFLYSSQAGNVPGTSYAVSNFTPGGSAISLDCRESGFTSATNVFTLHGALGVSYLGQNVVWSWSGTVILNSEDTGTIVDGGNYLNAAGTYKSITNEVSTNYPKRYVAHVTPSADRVFVIRTRGDTLFGPADTNENTLATITIPKGVLGAHGYIRVRHSWAISNNANNKTLRVRYSGGAGTAFYAVTTANTQVLVAETIIQNANATNSQRGGTVSDVASGLGTSTTDFPTAAVDTEAADTTVVITCQKASAGDTVALRNYTVEVVRG